MKIWALMTQLWTWIHVQSHRIQIHISKHTRIQVKIIYKLCLPIVKLDYLLQFLIALVEWIVKDRVNKFLNYNISLYNIKTLNSNKTSSKIWLSFILKNPRIKQITILRCKTFKWEIVLRKTINKIMSHHNKTLNSTIVTQIIAKIGQSAN